MHDSVLRLMDCAKRATAGLPPHKQVRCPACREPVRHDASLCKHCGSALVPTELRKPLPEERYGLAIAIATLVLMVAAAKACT